jgi:hypothetical protein
MRTPLGLLLLVLAPLLGACESFGVGNPQTEWTTTEGPGDAPVSSLESPPPAPTVMEWWVPYVAVDPPHHRDREHVRPGDGNRVAARPSSHSASGHSR